MNLRCSDAYHCSSVRSSSEPPGEEPAQVTSVSMRPKCSSAASTAASTCSVRVMSPVRPRTSPAPHALISATAWSTTTLSRATIATLQPSSAKIFAEARPMPLLPPVMNTISPSKPSSIHSSFVCSGGDELLAPHLPHLVGRQSVHDEHPLRALEPGQPLAAVGDQLLRIRRGSGTGDDESHDLLTPARRRRAHDGRSAHGRVLLESRFDLAREDVQAAGDDHVLAAARDGDRPVRGVLPRDVAGAEPAVGEGRLRLARPAQIAVEDLRAAHDELAVLAGRDVRAAAVEDAHL